MTIKFEDFRTQIREYIRKKESDNNLDPIDISYYYMLRNESAKNQKQAVKLYSIP